MTDIEQSLASARERRWEEARLQKRRAPVIAAAALATELFGEDELERYADSLKAEMLEEDVEGRVVESEPLPGQ